MSSDFRAAQPHPSQKNGPRCVRETTAATEHRPPGGALSRRIGGTTSVSSDFRAAQPHRCRKNGPHNRAVRGRVTAING